MGESRIDFGCKWERSWAIVGMVLGTVCNEKNGDLATNLRSQGYVTYIQTMWNSFFFFFFLLCLGQLAKPIMNTTDLNELPKWAQLL
jgi:hypothetical protein